MQNIKENIVGSLCVVVLIAILFLSCSRKSEVDKKDLPIQNGIQLRMAVLRNDTLKLKECIANGAALGVKDEHGIPPLVNAIEFGYLGAVKILLNHGVDVNQPDDSGRTALLVANSSEKEDTAIIRHLLVRGAKPNTKDNGGRTALMQAALHGFVESMKMLIDNGANVNDTEMAGWTALSDAAMSGNINAVKLLLQNGISAESKKNTIATLEHSATKINDKDSLLALLKK